MALTFENASQGDELSDGSVISREHDVSERPTEINPGTPWQPSREENLASKNQTVQIGVEPSSVAAVFFNGNI